MNSTYIDIVNNSFILAEQNRSLIDIGILQMSGMSGSKTRHFYNNICSYPDIKYLEIGTWKGSTVCSAMCNNNNTVVCIDNFNQFDGPKEEFLNNFNKYKGLNNALFIEGDCFQIDKSSLPKFNIYLYDGDHEYQDHYKALEYYIDIMDDMFVFIIDDWNWEKIRNGTKDAIKDLGLNIVYHKEIFTTHLNDVDYTGWWNGICVYILSKNT